MSRSSSATPVQSNSGRRRTGLERSQAALVGATINEIADSLDEPIIGKDLDGIVRFWNRAAEQLYGYRAEEMIGRPIAVLFPRERRHELLEIMAVLRRGERIERLRTERRHRDGRRLSISLTIAPIRGQAGEVAGAVAIAHDVTDLTRSVETERFLADVGRMLPEDPDHLGVPARAVRLIVPRFADWCTLELLDAASGELRQVAVSHLDTRMEPLLAGLRQHPPLGLALDARDVSGAALPTCELVQLDGATVETVETVETVAVGKRELTLLRQLAPRSAIVAPLVARRRLLGALLLVRTCDERRYDKRDLGAAQDAGLDFLSGRVALDACLRENFVETVARRRAAIHTSGRSGLSPPSKTNTKRLAASRSGKDARSGSLG